MSTAHRSTRRDLSEPTAHHRSVGGRGAALSRVPWDAVLVWAVTLGYVVPMFAGSFVVPKGFRPITEEAPSVGPVVERVGLVGAVVVLLACLAVLAIRRGELRRLLSPVLLLVVAWGVAVLGLLTWDAEVSQRLVLVPAICLAFALVRPGLAAVRALGWATVGLAGTSLVLAVVRPDAVRYQRPPSLQDDKFVWAHGILSGPFGSGNNLGLALAVGLPAVMYLGRRWLRTIGVVVVLLALGWTFSRTSWVGALAALGLGVVLILLPRVRSTSSRLDLSRVRRVAAALALSGTGLVALALPVATSSDTAFSNRGGFWQHGLDAWQERPWTGWGSGYYGRLAESEDNIGGFAFHAHNQWLHLLVIGGILLFVPVVAAFVSAAVAAVRMAGEGFAWPATMLTALFVSTMFEVPLGLVDRSMFYPAVLVPLSMVLTAGRPPRAQPTHG